jgi:hypothetical protein
MPDYRLYFLDGDSHIQGAEDLCAGDDAAAISLAQQRGETSPVELWTGSRKVWRFVPAPETADARHD